MRKQTKTQKGWIRAIALIVIVSFLCDQVSFALQPNRPAADTHTLNPSSRFAPVVEGEGFSMREQESELTRRLKNDAGLLYISHLIGKVLAANGSIISARGLQRLLRKHVAALGMLSFDIDGLRKEGKTFCLPYMDPERGKRCALRYYLPEDELEANLRENSIPIGIGSVRVIFEEEADRLDLARKQFYINIASLMVPAEPSEEEEARLDEQISAFLEKYQFLLGAKGDYVGDVMFEMKLNLYEHGNGGNLTVSVGVSSDFEPRTIRIISEDSGPGLSSGPNDIIKRSVERSRADDGGMGMILAALVPDRVEIETNGRKWTRKDISSPSTEMFSEDGDSDVITGTRITMDFSLDFSRKGLKYPGAVFSRRLEEATPYKLQDTFKRAATFNKSKERIPKRSRKFLLSAIEVYFDDTPIHDLQDLMIFIEKSGQDGSIGDVVTRKLISKIHETASRLREYYYQHDPEITKPSTDREMDDFIRLILALKDEQLSIIDGLITALTDLAPDAELVYDGAVYFRARVAQFFEDLQQKHRRILFEGEVDALLRTVKALPAHQKVGEDEDVKGDGRDEASLANWGLIPLAFSGGNTETWPMAAMPVIPGEIAIAALVITVFAVLLWRITAERKTEKKTQIPPEEEKLSERGADTIVAHVFNVLGISDERLKWKQEVGGYSTAVWPALDLNWKAAQTAFNLPETSLPAGQVMLVKYQDIPIYAFLQQGDRSAHVLDLLRYYDNIDGRKVAGIAGGITKIAGIHKRTEFIVDKPFAPYIYAAEEPSAEIPPVTNMLSQRGLEAFAHIKIPVLPGVFCGTHISSKLSASAAIKYAGPGKRVLVIGTGPGTEAVMAAKKGATVDAVDIKEMSIANTKLTCSIAGVSDKVNVFRNDLFNGLGKYDLIVFNMPHYYPGSVPGSLITPSTRNMHDFNGELLSLMASGVAEHLTLGGKAVLVNSSDPMVESVMLNRLPEGVTLMSEGDQGSRLYILTKNSEQENREKDKEPEKEREAGLGKLARETLADKNGKSEAITTPIIRNGMTETEAASRKKARAKLEKFIEAIRDGRYQDGRVIDLRKLPADKEIILIGDLHERLENLRRILDDERVTVVNGESITKTVYQRVRDGDAVLVFLGDAVHSEMPKNGSADLSMERSIRMMEWIAELKTENPDNVYYILGNHDNIDWPCEKGGVDQSKLYRDKLFKTYELPISRGKRYIDLYREFISNSPLLLVADGLVATHAAPIKGHSLRQIRKISHEDLMRDFTGDEYRTSVALWGRHKKILDKLSPRDRTNLTEGQKDFIKKTIYSDEDVVEFLDRMGETGGVFVSGHTPQLLDSGSFYSRVSESQFIVYAGGPFAGYAAYASGDLEMVDINGKLGDHTYRILDQTKKKPFWRRVYEKIVRQDSGTVARQGSGESLPDDGSRELRRTNRMYSDIAGQARGFIEDNKTVYWGEDLRITTAEGHAYEVQRRLAREGVPSEIFYWVRNGEFHVWVKTRDGFIVDAYPRMGGVPRVIRQGHEGDEYKGDHISKLSGSVENKRKWDDISETLEMPAIMEEIAGFAKKEANTPDVRTIEDVERHSRDVKTGNETWGYYAPTPTGIALQILLYMKTLDPDAKVCDIGSGKGRFALLAAAAPSVKFPSVTGIEVREALHLGADEAQKELAEMEGIDNATFINGNFLEEDLSEYDILYFFYTNPTDMSALEFNRILREKMVSPTGMKPGAKWIVWGDYEGPINNDEELSHQAVFLGNRPGLSHELSVYTRHETGTVARQGSGEGYPEEVGMATRSYGKEETAALAGVSDEELLVWNASFVRDEAVLTGEMAELIARHAGLSPPEQEFMRKAGLAHDIGKKWFKWYFDSLARPPKWFRKIMSFIHEEATIIILKLKGIKLKRWEREVLRHHSYLYKDREITSETARKYNTILVIADQLVARYVPRRYKADSLKEYDQDLAMKWLRVFFDQGKGIEGDGKGVLPQEDRQLIDVVEKISHTDEFNNIIERSLKSKLKRKTGKRSKSKKDIKEVKDEEAGDVDPNALATIQIVDQGTVYDKKVAWEEIKDAFNKGEKLPVRITGVARYYTGDPSGFKVEYKGIKGFVKKRHTLVDFKADEAELAYFTGVEIELEILFPGDPVWRRAPIFSMLPEETGRIGKREDRHEVEKSAAATEVRSGKRKRGVPGKQLKRSKGNRLSYLRKKRESEDQRLEEILARDWEDMDIAVEKGEKTAIINMDADSPLAELPDYAASTAPKLGFVREEGPEGIKVAVPENSPFADLLANAKETLRLVEEGSDEELRLKEEKKPKIVLPDGSPYSIYRIMRENPNLVFPDEIRLMTKGRTPEGHLSAETVKRDLGTLVFLGLVDKRVEHGEEKYRVKPTDYYEWEKIRLILESLGARPTSEEKRQAKEQLESSSQKLLKDTQHTGDTTGRDWAERPPKNDDEWMAYLQDAHHTSVYERVNNNPDIRALFNEYVEDIERFNESALSGEIEPENDDERGMFAYALSYLTQVDPARMRKIGEFAKMKVNQVSGTESVKEQEEMHKDERAALLKTLVTEAREKLAPAQVVRRYDLMEGEEALPGENKRLVPQILERTGPQKNSEMLRRINEWFYRFKGTKTFSDVFSTSASRGSPWTRSEAERFVRQLDQMVQHGKLPEVITVYEIGCGNCRFAGEFLSYMEELNPEYYKRISYVIGDFSPEMLEEASKTSYIKPHLDHVSFIEVDATKPLPFTEPALLIRANELLDDLMPMQLLKKENGEFYEMQVEVRVDAATGFRTRNGEMVGLDLAVKWMRENALEQLAGLDPSFLEKIEIVETWSLIEDISDYPYGEDIREAYKDSEYAEIPFNEAAFDFAQRAVRHLYPGYGQFIAYDYGIYEDSKSLTGVFRRYGGQPTMDVNFLLLEKILEEKLGSRYVRIQRQPEYSLYSDGLDSVLGRNFYRMEVVSPLVEGEEEEGQGQEAQKFIDSVIEWIETRAIATGKRGEKLVIGIDTSWIPETQLDLAGMQQLLASIRTLSRGRLKGFEDIEVCINDDPRALAAGVWAARRSKDPKAPLTPLSNVVILGDEDILDAELFRSFRGTKKEESAFFAKVRLPEDLSEETDIDLLTMVANMLSVVSSSKADSPHEFYVEVPDAGKVPLHRLTEIYEARSKALTMA